MKKLIAILLCITLLTFASASVFAETSTTNPLTQTDLTETDIVSDNITPKSQTDISPLQQDINNDPVVSVAADLTRGVTSGVLDAATQSSIRGWAWNSGTPNTAINVHIYIKKDGATQLFKSVLAGNYRADLYNAGYGNGYHGFSYPINWKTYIPGQYQVYAYGINGSSNPMLTGSPKNFTVRAATGVVDAVNYNGISGWAWKPDAPNETINVHIYIRRANGERVALYAPVAGNYRSDLYNLGYGNGYHGFYRSIDWESLPREILTVQVYAVDGSGHHPCFYNQTFDNRQPINLFAESDYNGHEMHHWITSSVIQDCKNIGASIVHAHSLFDDYHIINAIYESSFFLIHTHGNHNSIEYNAYSEPRYLYSSDFDDYSNTYFSNTKCVTIMACSAASGGYSNPNNFVNTLQSKGVQTVVGFKDEIWFNSYENGNINPNMSAGLWGRMYIEYLSQGLSVQAAVTNANYDVYEQSNYTNWWGFDSYYIAGNANQIIKH